MESYNTNIRLLTCSVQSLSYVRLFATPWTAVCQASLSITNSRSVLKLMAIVSDAIQPSHPLSSPSPPAFKLSQHQALFKWVSSLHQVAKVLEFQLQRKSFQWIFRTDLLALCYTLVVIGVNIFQVKYLEPKTDYSKTNHTPISQGSTFSCLSFSR